MIPMGRDVAEILMAAVETENRIPTIVIAEDHAGIRSSVKQWLSRVFDEYEIRDVGTGEDAVELCRKTKPELVVMDIKMPGINGILATQQIKKILPDTKIIILTIYDVPAFRAGALEAGASAFLSKNDMYRELIPTIRRLIAS
jgi:DNA-binding NarL/FixJ family response regulator